MKHLPYLSLAAVYLGLAAPAFGDDTARTVKPNITLADKVSCDSVPEAELEKKNLICVPYFIETFDILLDYDGMVSSSEKGSISSKDGKLEAKEYGKAVVGSWLSPTKDMPVPTLSAYLVGEVIRTMFIPLDINGDCYLTLSDDVNNDNRITLEDLTLFQATHPGVRCSNYEQPQVRPEKKK